MIPVPPRPFIAAMKGTTVFVTAHTFGEDGTDDRVCVQIIGGAPPRWIHTHSLTVHLGAVWSAMTLDAGSEEIESACWHSILPVRVRR